MRLWVGPLAAAAGALAFPVAASGAGAVEGLSTAKVTKNDGFKLSFRVGPNFRHGPVTLEALLHNQTGRGLGSVLQNSFDSGLTFRGSKELGSAHASGTLADKRGFINMTFTATGPPRKSPCKRVAAALPARSAKAR